MLKLNLTDQALKSIAQNRSMTMQYFVASSCRTQAQMQAWLDNPGSYSGSFDFFQYPLDSVETYLIGERYPRNPKPGEPTVTVTENFLEIIGSLNSTLVSGSFMLRSLGITAKASGSSDVFLYAFGTLASADKPYPINPYEAVTYITPVKIVYSSLDSIRPDEAGVPWRNFYEHTDTSVSSAEGVHGLKIDPNTKKLTVGNTTITLSDYDDRISQLEREATGVLKYYRQDDREYNSEWEPRMTGSGTLTDPYLIFTPRDLNEVRKYPSAYFRMENNLDMYPCIGIKARVTDTGYEILDEYTDDTAPCYNKGMGWMCLYLNHGHFDGNGKFIKNLFIGPLQNSEFSPGGILDPVPYKQIYGISESVYKNRRSALFLQLDYSNLINLNIIESVIVVGDDDDTHGLSGSGMCSYMDSHSMISKCSSSADIVTMFPTYAIGGICADKQSEGLISYCAFHGSFRSEYRGTNNSMLGGICCGALNGTTPYVVGCCCDSAIPNFAGERAGICRAFSGTMNACYFAGEVEARPSSIENESNIENMGTLIVQTSSSNQRNLARELRNCFSMEGSADPKRVQGTILSRAYMQSRDFVNDLNALLPEAMFVYAEGQFPRLNFEEDHIPYDSPIATIDTDTRYVLDSGYDVQRISQMATSQDVAQVLNSLTSYIDSKSTVHIVKVEIGYDDWVDSAYRYYTTKDVVLDYGQDVNNNIMPIPPDQNFFSYGIYANKIGYDTRGEDAFRLYIEFKYTARPVTAISFDCIIIKGGRSA